MNETISLANKYRPATFSTVIGQKVVVTSLQKKLMENQFPKTALFHGVRGTGKTTMARIVAKTVNCDNPTENGPCCQCESCLAVDAGNNTDVIELDAASKNKVSDVEGIIENAKFLPFRKKKVIILDEVHMLSTAAFNKLLKIVEEPPEHCHFIFCTTEKGKIPATILSRCKQYEFRKVSDSDILENLKRVCEAECIIYEEDALCMITKAAGGSLRDSLSILEQLSYGNEITAELVSTTLGLATDEAIFSILMSVSERKPQIAVSYLTEIMDSGKNIVSFLHAMIDVLMDVINIHNGLSLRSDAVTQDYQENINTLAASITSKQANDYIKELTKALSNGKSYGLEFAAEIAVLNIIEQEEDQNLLKQRVDALEKTVEALQMALQNGSATADVKEAVPYTAETAEQYSMEAMTQSFSAQEEKESDMAKEILAVEDEVPEIAKETFGFVGTDVTEIPFDLDDNLVPGTADMTTPTGETTQPVPKLTLVTNTPSETENSSTVTLEEPKSAPSIDKTESEPFEIPGGTVIASESAVPMTESNNTASETSVNEKPDEDKEPFYLDDDNDGICSGMFQYLSSYARQSN